MAQLSGVCWSGRLAAVYTFYLNSLGYFNNRVVLITGASAGLGAALARAFAAEGANLVLLARRQARLTALAAELDPEGKCVLALPCDVTQDGELAQAVKLAQQKFAAIDVAIANAGWGVDGKLETLSVDDYRRLWETNVFGVLRTIYATLPDLKQTHGSLVVIGSIKGYFSLSSSSAYSSSKFALRALCESLRPELKPYNVAVTHICPGGIATELRQVDNDGVWHPDWPEPISATFLLTADQAARHILVAIKRRQPEQILPHYAWLLVLLKRYWPGLIPWIFSKFNQT